jgi:curved DNA-binding protein CbpA
MEIADYYELLQISPNAERETIQRVYRFLAGRFHPDIPETGDPEKFLLLKEAFDVLSDPERRAQYDAAYKEQAPQPVPLSTSIDFMDRSDGELNRRSAVLALLYFQRRANPYFPEVSLTDIEMRMGFPRDYLDFTMWYLRSKNYIAMADNASSAITALGVDFVESNRVNTPVLNKLLTGGTGPSTPDGSARSQILTPSRTPLRVTAGNGQSEGVAVW